MPRSYVFRFIYLSPYPHLSAVKIGSAYDVVDRMNKISRFWGLPDHSKVEIIRFRNADGNPDSRAHSECNSFETLLHRMLLPHRKFVGFGDGESEFYELDVILKVHKILALYRELNPCRPRTYVTESLPIERKFNSVPGWPDYLRQKDMPKQENNPFPSMPDWLRFENLPKL